MGKETPRVVVEELFLSGARLEGIGRTKGKLEEVQECAHDLLLSHLASDEGSLRSAIRSGLRSHANRTAT
jgi:hypothetical protein